MPWTPCLLNYLFKSPLLKTVLFLLNSSAACKFTFLKNMNTLFPTGPIFPEGFRYIPDFISATEEQELLRWISETERHTFIFQGYEAKRKVASFGYDYSFDKKHLDKGKPIPKNYEPLIQKVATEINLPANEFAELLITEYPVGSVINWHRDAFPFDVIAGISLQADCTFRLRPHDKIKQTRNSIISFPVRRRSLYIISGSSRTDWQHSIAPVKEIRFSITLRSLRNK
jgi:alkylated DNA repair dioxygenase AlkB